MRNENNCIRYLMKEMDPSEELLMERAMMEDENLLIEVESMRQTLAKLDKLPRKNPPSELTDRIIKQAADHAKHNRGAQTLLKPIYKYAVAATLALTVTAGGAWLFMEKADLFADGEGSGDSSVSERPSQPWVRGSSTDFLLNNGESNFFRVASGEVDPWVDRENILHFEDYMINSNGDFNALIEQSNQKLKLIENSIINNRPVKSIQLTGTGN